MRYLLINLLIATLATSAFSEPLSVRSGNHPEFNRLTFPIKQGQSWDARRTDNGIRVTISNHEDGFDTQTVFARMHSDRIADLKSTANSLQLEIGCDCEATAFISAGLLVIDVADRGARLAAAPITAFADAPTPLPREKRTHAASVNSLNSLPWIGSGAPATEDQSDHTRARESVETVEIEFPQEPMEDRTRLLGEMQQKLSKKIASAASVGLLTNSFEAPQIPVDTLAQATLESETVQMLRGPEANKPSRNIRITSSMDSPPGSLHPEGQISMASQSCPSNEYLSVDTWGGTGKFADEIGQARNDLYDARDNLAPDAIVKLAKTYIYFGFGAEALDVLGVSEPLRKKHPELVALASIMERGHVTGSNPLGSFTDCNSDVALWAALSYSKLPDGIILNKKAVLRAVNKMPKHLRQFLAPALSDRLLKYGDGTSAATAMRSIERLPDPLLPAAKLAKAQIAVQNGTPAAALFEEVIGTNTGQSPEALLSLVNTKLAANESISTDTVELIVAYAQELRGTEVGNRLRIVEIFALSQNAQFDGAFEALEDISPILSPDKSREMRQVVLEQLSERGDDITFLEHMFSQDLDEIGRMGLRARLSMAERLMTLGFASQVQKILSGIPSRPPNIQRQLLAAKAAITLGQPFQAQAALIGIDDPQVAPLMAQAKEMTGAYSEAAEFLAKSDTPQDLIRAAWLSDDWRNLIPAETPNFGAQTEVGTEAPEAAAPDAGPLASASAALEESQSARTALSTLLRDPMLAVETNMKVPSQ